MFALSEQSPVTLNDTKVVYAEAVTYVDTGVLAAPESFQPSRLSSTPSRFAEPFPFIPSASHKGFADPVGCNVRSAIRCVFVT